MWFGSKCESALVKMTEVLISPEVGFMKSDADQCLFVKQGRHGPVVLLLCVDDS